VWVLYTARMLERVGPYRVEGEVGRGGMGVVYRAVDERLGRAVAIKALPEEVATDAARLERFEREARAMASVNHPNVAGIYGVEEAGGSRYLAMEYVEGETLGDRLDRGQMGVDEALDVCVQIAAGVEAAHEAGVVHRDLKPANVKLTPDGQVKVLDFGLAKGDAGISSTGSGLSQAVTATTPLGAGRGSPTAEGAVLGTAAYMSPEQARGRGVDKRTDVWAFGVILYECLTGVGPFVGETATDSIGAVLHKDVDLDRLPEGTPVMVRHVLERCLERDKGRRYRDIGDVRIELERAKEEPRGMGAVMTGGEVRGRAGVVAWLGWAVAVVALGLGGAWIGLNGLGGDGGRVVRTSIMGPEGWAIEQSALSPDGSRVLLVCDRVNPENSMKVGNQALFVRELGGQGWERVPGSEKAWHAQFSPDGQTIAFLRVHPRITQAYELMRVPSDLGQSPVKVAELDDTASVPSSRWFCWTPDSELVYYEQRDTSLRIVDPGTGQGGRLLELTGEFDDGMPGTAFGGPFGDRHLMMGLAGFDERGYREDIGLIDLETGERRTVVRDGRALRLAPDGSVLFGRGDTLFRSGWDGANLRLSGELEVVQSGVLTTNIWANAVGDVSARGDLLFATGGAQGADRRIVFGDADGNEFEWGEEGRAYEDQIAISRDGQRFAAIVVNPRGSFDLWAGERGGERLRMLYGSDSTDVVYPLLSWDGEWVYATEAAEEYSDLRVFRVPFDGSGRREMLWEGGSAADFHRLRSISEDGTKLLFDRRLYGGNHDVTLLDLERAADEETGVVEMVVVIPGQSAERARLDPLGIGLISYIASPTGLRELFVRPWDPEAPEVLGPAVSVSRDFAYHSWVVVPGEDAGDGTRAPDRLFIVELSLQRGFTRTEVVYENGRIRLGEREAMDRQPIANTVTGDVALDGTEIAVRRGESERLLDRVELVQGLLGR